MRNIIHNWGQKSNDYTVDFCRWSLYNIFIGILLKGLKVGVRLNTEQFIAKAVEIHGDTYDYSLVEYKNCHTKVKIVCRIHGAFEQTPNSHNSQNQGCPMCGQAKKDQTCLAKYGTKFPSQTKEIKDKIKQTDIERFGGRPQQLKEIKDKIKQTNMLRYGVENPNQLKVFREKAKITNLVKYGVVCPLQNKNIQAKTQQTVLTKYEVKFHKQKHMVDILPLIENYDWLFDQYTTQGKTAWQISKELGIGDGAIGRYLRKLEIKIRKTQQSYISKVWLELVAKSENITITYEFPFEKGSRTRADGYCIATNTIYEFHGDCWHGNPKRYNQEDNCHPRDKSLTAGYLYQKTIEREEKIKSLGYNLVVMWESDWKEQQRLSKIK